MEKGSTSKPSLKLFRQQSATKSGKKATRALLLENVSATTEGETDEVLQSDDVVTVESETFCELNAAETCDIETEGVEDEQPGRNNSPANVKHIPEDEIADILPPDGREVAVVISWNWDSSQRNLSPKPEKTKSTTPVGQKKRSSRICSPLMGGQPPARRKRLLKKELTSTKSSFVSELRALSEKLQKAKECVQITEDADNDENELCFELSNSSTEKLHFRQELSTFKLDNLEEIKNDSFKTLLEDVDDDCLIQCSQEVEKTLQDFASPLKKSPKIQNLVAVKSEKNSPSRSKTPSKSRTQNNIPPRRSPRIRNQNPLVTYSGKPRSNPSVVKSADADRVLDEDLVESLLDDEIELLSQIPSPSSIFNSIRPKLCTVANTSTFVNVPLLPKSKTKQILSKQYGQGTLNGIVNLNAVPSCAASVQCLSPVRNTKPFSGETQHVVRSCHRPDASFLTKNYSVVKSDYDKPKNYVVVNKQEKAVISRHKESAAGIGNSVKPFDDSFGDPALCTLLESVESSVLPYSPVKSSSPERGGEKSSTQQQIPSSPPLRCTPEEIEKKKREALERRRKRNHVHQNSSLNSRSVQQLQVPSSPPRRYTPEEIEKKRLEALQIKRQQSLFRTTTYSNGPRQRPQRK